MLKTFARSLMAVSLLAISAVSSQAQTAIDFSSPWPENNFSAIAARKFADAVNTATAGDVVVTVHQASEIGVTGSGSMSAVEDGVVQMASYLLFLQAGDEPFLAIDTLPFLIRGQDEMKAFLEVATPKYEEIAERNNQKILYYVPWPSPGVYSRREITSVEDMKGARIRAFNPASFQFLSLMGAAPLEMPWGDVASALAAGTIDGVATSTSSGVDGKLWDLTTHFSPMKWSTSTDVVAINLDTWNEISPENQAKIEAIAKEMQSEFWALSAGEDDEKGAILKDNGLIITEANEGLLELMGKSGRTMWDEFVSRVPEAGPVIEAYTAKVKK